MFRLLPWMAISLLTVFAVPSLRADDTGADEQVLKRAGFKSDAGGLLALFRKLSPNREDRQQLSRLVQQLGADRFDDREQASRLLVQWQLPALVPLRQALDHPDPEIKRRAQTCIEEIETGPGSALPMAAARLLALRRPPTAIATLLDYLPHTTDTAIHDVVCDALAGLAVRPGSIDPALRAALNDPLAVRRGAAAFALGRSADLAIRKAVADLLRDREAPVRLRAVQGLLAGLDRQAVPALIDLVLEPPGELSWRVEEILGRLAGEQPPPLPSGDDAAARQKRRDAWSLWWKEKGAGINLARLNERPPFLGITLVPEMHANKVWEFDRDGKVLWELGGLQCPIDAQVLPAGRVLVAELNGNRVTERDRAGKVLWEHKVQTPIACQRLANGVTFIGTNSRLFTVTADGKETWSYTAGNDFFIHSVQRMSNGHYAMVSMAGTLREIDAAGKEVRSLPLPIQGGWSGIESVPGGRYLVANPNHGKVLEIDAQGKTLWEYQGKSCCYATRLPNGNTLLVSNSTGLQEVDRQGTVVAEKRIATSLWRVHRR